MPGLPKLPFLALGAGLWLAARRVAADATRPTATKTETSEAPAQGTVESALDEFLQTDRACIEIGARLIPLVDPKRGSGLLDRIATLRRDLGRKHGLWVPPIRIRDNMQLEPEAYRLMVGGREVSRGRIQPDAWLAVDPGNTRFPVQGQPTTDPAFGLPALWIVEAERQRAELAGYTVVDAPSVLITHLGEIVKRHAHELLGREDLKALVDKVRETAPTLVDELIPNVLTMGAVHRVLGLLLEEHVPISNLTRLLESLANHAVAVKDPIELTDRVRLDLGRVICDRCRDEQGRLHAIVLDPRLEMDFRKAMHDKHLAIEPAKLEKLIACLANAWRKATASGAEVALLTDATLRRPLRNLLSRSLRDLPVIAYQEVPSDLLLDPAALVKPEDLLSSPSPPPSA